MPKITFIEFEWYSVYASLRFNTCESTEESNKEFARNKALDMQYLHSEIGFLFI